MDTLKLIGSFKGSAFRTIYSPIGNNIYNSTSKLSSLYDTNITTPLNNQVLYFLSPSYSNKTLIATSGKDINIFWNDLFGRSAIALNIASLTFTYSNASSKYIQYQRLSSGLTLSNMTLNTTKMNTNGIYSLINTVDTANFALTNTVLASNNAVVSSTMASYLIANTSGILLRNECYNRNFEINGYIQLPTTGFSAGASFKLYIYLGTDIIAQTQVYCVGVNNPVYINLYAVIRTTVLDLNKYIDFKIQYLGTGLTMVAGNLNFVVKCL